MKEAQTLGRRVAEAVVISLACAGALWLFQNPVGAGELVERIVSFVGQVEPAWFTPVVWVAGILLALALGITLLRLTDWGGAWLFGAGPIAATSVVFGLAATSLRMCASANALGLVPAALAVWVAVRIVLRLRRAWMRFSSPAFI